MTARRPYRPYKPSKGIVTTVKRVVYRSIDKIKIIRNKIMFTHVDTLQNAIDFFDPDKHILVEPPEAIYYMADDYRQMLINADMWSEKLEINYKLCYRDMFGDDDT